MSEPTEFDCGECGRHIVSIIALTPTAPRICATCTLVPGWIEDPILRKALDPCDDVDASRILGSG